MSRPSLQPPHPCTNRATWDAAIARLTMAHTLQSWDWGEFKSRWGWTATRLLWRDQDDQVQAAAQVLARPLGPTPWRMLYVPKGPLLRRHDPALLAAALTDLERHARQQRAIFIKIDPDIVLGGSPDNDDSDGLTLQSTLQERGWVYANQQIQFPNTVILNLEPDEEALLAAMKSKWRYNIRLAGRKGVQVHEAGVDDLPHFYQLYAATAARDGFLIRPEAYYRDIWQQYLRAGRAALLLASVEGEAVAGLMLFFFDRTAWYFYGASSDAHRKLMPNHLLQWRAIQAARARGCTRYDMWGAPTVFDDSDPMWGVYRFKLGFGGHLQRSLGAYDYPVWPLAYRLYNHALPQLLAFLRRWRR